MYFGAVVIHELLHLKAHLSVEIQESGKKLSKTIYRRGITIQALQSYSYHRKNHQHFDGLHEAIVTEAEKKLMRKLLELPELAKEKEWLSSDEAKEIRKKIAREQDLPEEDIIWVSKKGENKWDGVAYFEQRKVLNYVCEEIHKQFPDQYPGADDVFKVFLNTNFTGRLLSLAHLVEKTFGEGSFRLLGNMGTDEASGILHLESLKKARVRQLQKLQNRKESE